VKWRTQDRASALAFALHSATNAATFRQFEDMEPDVESARSRYRAAYDAYQACARRVAQKLENGSDLLAEEIDEEAEAIERLAQARRVFLEAITRPE
jgi:hypothetical protein